MARGFEVTTGLVIQQGLWEESSTSKHKLGTRMQLADGRVFYYALAGGTIAAGSLLSSKVDDAQNSALAIGAAAAAGSKTISSITIGSTALTTGQLNEGFVSIQTGATDGYGHLYKIKSHTTGSGSATDIALTLYDPIKVALTTSSTIGLHYNPFFDVISQTTETTPVAGVPMFAITDNYYFWCQTWGMANVKGTDTAAAGSLITADSTNASVGYYSAASEAAVVFTSHFVGFQYGIAHASGEWRPVMLQLYP